MCRLACVASILLSSSGFVALAAGEQDEHALLQAQASVKARSPDGAAAAQNPPLCVDDEAPLDFSAPLDLAYIHDTESVDAPSVHKLSAQVHVKTSRAEPDPALVLLVRLVLWFLSSVFVTITVMRWWGREASSSECQPTTAGQETNVSSKLAATSTRSLLRKAALAGDEARCVQLLDEAGVLYCGGFCADLIATDSWGTTALHAAAIGGAYAVAELFLEHGAPVDSMNACDETPLHLAARGGHMELCCLLVKSGASLSAVNTEGKTPVNVACDAGHFVVCEALLALGADETLP